MDEIPYYDRLQSSVQAWLDAEHFKTTYWLACYNRQTGEVVRLSRMHRKDPTRIKGLLPIEPLYEGALIEMAYDGSFKWVGGPYSIIDP